ncbi:MAG: hypothetical protein GXO43_09110 [Crenarchaeota archaeon]|nr:hypothetical protein [Thermoproteota archaeon]
MPMERSLGIIIAIIVDLDQSLLLENAGKPWAMKRIVGFYTVSSALTIDNDWDMYSDNLVECASKRIYVHRINV